MPSAHPCGRARHRPSVGVVWHSAGVPSRSQDSAADARSAVVDAAHAAVARATAREVAVHESYDRARNVLRLQARRRALVPLTREMLSTPGTLDAHAGRSMPAYAWGLPVARRRQLLAVICPTASAITPAIRAVLSTTVIVVASVAEEDRLARVTDPRQRFAVLSVRVPEPAHEEIVDFARRNPTPRG